MARTIKRVTHDLMPTVVTASECGLLLNDVLQDLQTRLGRVESTLKLQLEECIHLAESLTTSTMLIKEYVVDLDQEADTESIQK